MTVEISVIIVISILIGLFMGLFVRRARSGTYYKLLEENRRIKLADKRLIHDVNALADVFNKIAEADEQILGVKLPRVEKVKSYVEWLNDEKE